MGIVAGFMVPHPPVIVSSVGMGRETEAKNTIEGYKKVAKKIAEIKPDTIVVATPHNVIYSDYFHISPGFSVEGDFREFGSENEKIKVEYDWQFVSELEEDMDKNDFPGGTLGEKTRFLDHGVMVPLYFINQEYKDYKIVRLSLSGLDPIEHYSFGSYIQEISNRLDRKTVFIASGDLSHRLKDSGPYGYQKEGPEYDEKIMNIMENADFEKLMEMDYGFCEKAAECGQRSFLIMAGALDGLALATEKLSYEGPFGVGYGICSFEVIGKDEKRKFNDIYILKQREKLKRRKENEDEYIKLARASLESFVIGKKVINIPDDISQELLKEKAGVFVSVKKDGQLRGCIGTIIPTKSSVAEEIINNAISAAVHDPRFEPVSKEELNDLEYSVDVLGKTESVKSVEELDEKTYGVIVKSGRKKGLLLPNLEGVNSVSEQISIARQKAGIGYNEDYEIERFKVLRHY